MSVARLAAAEMSPGRTLSAPWCSGLTRCPVKAEIGGSNPLGVAIRQRTRPARPAGLAARAALGRPILDLRFPFDALRAEDLHCK